MTEDEQKPLTPEEYESFPLSHVPKDYDAEFSGEDVEYLEDYFTKMRHNPTASATLICKGTQCEIYKHCPLGQLAKKLPVGKPCPVERQLVDIWTNDLMSELGIEEDAHVDRAQVAELVRNRLFTKRTQEILANSTSIVESFKGFDPEGNPLVEPKLHPLLPMFERSSKISEKIMDSLIATREAKSRDKSREVVTQAQIVSALMHRMRAIQDESEPQHLISAKGNLDREKQLRLEVVSTESNTPELIEGDWKPMAEDRPIRDDDLDTDDI